MFAKSIVLSLGIAAATLVGCANAGETAQSSNAVAPAHQVEKTSRFRGVKANTGYATLTHVDGKRVLAVSDDFVIPNTPAPSWQIVDSSGNVYLLQQFRIKDNKTNRTITLPAYIPDVAKVQVWCSFAEVLLGEASFEMPVK
jgi:hypothetical protein